MNNWKKIALSPDTSVIEAMKIIDLAGTQFVMVIDSEETLMGVVTDGDVRRGILKDIPLSSPVREIMNSKPLCLAEGSSRSEVLEFLEKNKISHVPLINAAKKVLGVVSHDDNFILSENINTAILMVGGLGSRLGELTTNCPKPMLRVGGKPVLQIIVENLKEHGFSDFIFCVNYKSEIIKDHFGDGSAMGISVRYVHESKRMGTAGALGLIPDETSNSILVMNGDIVTKVNFTKFLQFHKESSANATMAVRKYDFQIPFGVVRAEEGKIIGIEEKPTHSFMVNAGIYMIDKICLNLIPQDEFFDMPHFFDVIRKTGKVTQAFPIHEYWLDIGREDDLIKAQQEFISEEKL